MDASKLAVLLCELGACQEARDWSRGKTLAEAWDTCERADWMLWLAARRLPRQRVVLVACACARTALKHVPAGEARPLRAIEMAERWARCGDVPLSDVRAAADAASADAAAAYAARSGNFQGDAAADAAYAAYAASAAAYADAAYAAADAAYAAADAAYAAAAAFAADAAADAADVRQKALREMAYLVREHISARDIETEPSTGGHRSEG